MFFFQSAPSLIRPIQKGREYSTTSTYSVSSNSSIDTKDSIEKEHGSVEFLPVAEICLQPPREDLHKRARQRLRNLCRYKSAKTIPIAPKETTFSYTVIPADAPAIPSFRTNQERAAETALIITYNEAQNDMQHTLESALQTFPRENIFVVGNGNTDRSINNTSVACAWFGVRHIWIPTRSKVAAQYVGVAAANHFRYCLLIEEDIALPADFPVYTDRIETRHASEYIDQAPVRAIGYMADDEDDEIESLEYRMSSLPETFFDKFGDVGCASFPHGEVSLWDRRLLEECFHQHPGYKNSPNWFLGINLKLVLERKER